MLFQEFEFLASKKHPMDIQGLTLNSSTTFDGLVVNPRFNQKSP